jgi:hypothetical protein
MRNAVITVTYKMLLPFCSPTSPVEFIYYIRLKSSFLQENPNQKYVEEESRA